MAKKSGVHKSLFMMWRTSGKVSFWVSKPEWAAIFALGRNMCYLHSLRFTSAATPADHLKASLILIQMAQTLHTSANILHVCIHKNVWPWFSPLQHGSQAILLHITVWFKARIYCATAAPQCKTRWTLYRLSYAGSAYLIFNQYNTQQCSTI